MEDPTRNAAQSFVLNLEGFDGQAAPDLYPPAGYGTTQQPGENNHLDFDQTYLKQQDYLPQDSLLMPLDLTNNAGPGHTTEGGVMSRFAFTHSAVYQRMVDDRRIVYGLVGAVVAVLALAFFVMTGEDSMVAGWFSSEPELTFESPKKAQDTTAKNTVAEKQVQKNTAAFSPDGGIPENPYWNLPNAVLTPKLPQRQMTQEESLLWKEGLQHSFTYQRFKTILEMKSFNLGGSEKLLSSALDEKKLWHKMAAAAAIAEAGHPVAVEKFVEMLDQSRPSLVYHYFKRFKHRSGLGERYVLRQAIKVVDSRSRAVILKALTAFPDEFTDLYLSAASFDPGPGIAAYAKAHLAARRVSTEKFQAYKNMIAGLEGFPQNLTPLPVENKPLPVSAAESAIDELAVKQIEIYDAAEGSGAPSSQTESAVPEEQLKEEVIDLR